jgi:hypothetical protein
MSLAGEIEEVFNQIRERETRSGKLDIEIDTATNSIRLVAQNI